MNPLILRCSADSDERRTHATSVKAPTKRYASGSSYCDRTHSFARREPRSRSDSARISCCPVAWTREEKIEADAKNTPQPSFSIDPAKMYTLAELVDLAESHNPETRIAWERARAQAASLGIARSELYPHWLRLRCLGFTVTRLTS